ncbi:MAG: helix-turn-helix transcriptional regulator [Firmicutes bacterium]|nr:helix-turn-helix transcriptional regulator [Bacillota bacterium]
MTNYEKHRARLLECPEFRAGYEQEMQSLQLGIHINAIRHDLSLTQKQFAEKIGIDQSLISKLETGEYNPSVQFLHKVANGIGKTLHIEFR